jgi:hypothetical protein
LGNGHVIPGNNRHSGTALQFTTLCARPTGLTNPLPLTSNRVSRH